MAHDLNNPLTYVMGNLTFLEAEVASGSTQARRVERALTGCERMRGVIAGLRERVEDLPEDWALVPTVIARAGSIAAVGLVGVAALTTAVAIFARGSEIVGLYEAANVDVLDAGLEVRALGDRRLEGVEVQDH